MAHHGPLWTQSGSYPAQADRSLLGALWPHGGASGGAVTAVLNTPTTSVAPGQAAVPLAPGQGSALCTWDTAEVLDHSPAPTSGTSRIDLIVVQVRDPDLDGGANSDFILTLVKGQPAMMAEARPGDDDEAPPEVEPFAGVAPAVPVNALALYSVTVPGGAANLNGATLRDLRLSDPYPLQYQRDFNIASGSQGICPRINPHRIGMFRPTKQR